MSSQSSQETRRVKVYQLDIKGEWIDKGTGHVHCSLVERNDSVPSIVVKSEEDTTVLLQSKISPDDIYNKQQETLIVWNEITDDDNEEGIDLALSFQDASGCAEIWDEITDIQRTLRTPDIIDFESLLKGEPEDTISTGHTLLPANLANIDEIHNILSDAVSLLPTRPKQRITLAQTICREKYLPKLVELWKVVDDLSSKEDCVKMYHIFKDIILLNHVNLLEQVVSNDCIFEILAALEHDPESGVGQVKHSNFMKNQAKFKEVVPLNSPYIENKIHQTFRLQYLKDVALARTLDEATFSTINSLIYLNNLQIVTELSGNEKVLTALFDNMKSPNISTENLKDCLQFLTEMCDLGKNIEARNKLKFYQHLTANGIFEVIESTLVNEEVKIRIMSAQILVYISEHDSSIIRSYIIKQQPDYIMFTLIINCMESDLDTCVKNLLTDVVRNITDIAIMEEGLEKVTFLSLLYKRFANTLFATLMRPLPPKGIHTDVESLLKNNLCELLAYFVQHHGTQYVIPFLTTKNVLKQILNLINCKDKFLVLAAIRLFRAIINVDNATVNDYIVTEKLFESIIAVFLKNGNKYNLLNSAVLELFDFLRKKNIKKLIAHVIANYWDKLMDIDYSETFKKLKEINDKNEYEPKTDDDTKDSAQMSFVEATRSRYRKKFLEQQREEAWFDEDENDDDFVLKDKEDETDPPPPHERRGKKRPLSPHKDEASNGISESPSKKSRIEK